jgi:glycosidase
LPHVDSAGELSVEAQFADRSSILWLYHDLLSLRRQSRALLEGSESMLDTPDGTVGWSRATAEERVDVFVNFTDEDQPLDVVGRVLISSEPERTAGEDSKPDFSGVLGPYEAIVIER